MERPTTSHDAKASSSCRNPPPVRCSRPSRRPGLYERVGRRRRRRTKRAGVSGEPRERGSVRRTTATLKKHVFRLFTRREVELEGRRTGFSRRKRCEIHPFDFVLCCAFGAVIESKRGFASIWRLLAAAVGVEVARSAVTQRFGQGSAALMQTMFERSLTRLPRGTSPGMSSKLKRFTQVLANDGTVLKLSPLLAKLFPATRTNVMKAAAKLHATADLLHRRIVRVELTGERKSELKVAQRSGIVKGTLYINDLGYTSYDYYAQIVAGRADFLMRLKDDANPTVVRVRHGVIAPRRSEGTKLNDLWFTQSHETFDLDARFETKSGFIELRVVGHYNPETKKYHCYVTSLSPKMFSVEELETLYSFRWVIELLFKLLKSSCHLDHLDTRDVHALRTLIYASLLAAVILSATVAAAAESDGIRTNDISGLVVGTAAPLLAIPLLLLWSGRRITPDEIAAVILRTVAFSCRDQNPSRTRNKWGHLN